MGVHSKKKKFAASQKIMTRFGSKIVNSRFYGIVDVSGLGSTDNKAELQEDGSFGPGYIWVPYKVVITATSINGQVFRTPRQKALCAVLRMMIKSKRRKVPLMKTNEINGTRNFKSAEWKH